MEQKETNINYVIIKNKYLELKLLDDIVCLVSSTNYTTLL